MHLYIDDDPTALEFTNGPTVNEDNGVLDLGAHTHRVHWKSPTSFRLYQLPSGVHRVRMDLVDGAHNVLPNPQASQSLTFTIAESTSGEFRLEPVLSGLLSFPSKMALTPDGRVFITEVYTGDLRVVDIVNGTWQLRPTPLYHVDGPALGPAIGDQGLTGIVLDQNFLVNGYIYINYTVLDGSANRVLRLKEVSGQVVEETVVIDNLPSAVTHNGGDLHFGPDGKLYLTTGEAEQSALAQDPTTLFGKMLRYNRDGSIPSDNLIPGSPVYAWGLRNTFDFLFHPLTGDIWATENGPDVNDEIDLIVRGGNYGWPVVTGQAGNPAYVDPLVVFPATIGPTGIVAISAQSAYPSAYHNQLLFTDVNAGRIHRIELESTNPTHVRSLTVAFDGGLGGLLDFIEGPDGYLYVSSLDSVYRVVLNINNGP